MVVPECVEIKTPSILSLNLIPLWDQEALSQEKNKSFGFLHESCGDYDLSEGGQSGMNENFSSLSF